MISVELAQGYEESHRCNASVVIYIGHVRYQASACKFFSLVKSTFPYVIHCKVVYSEFSTDHFRKIWWQHYTFFIRKINKHLLK